jgi:hypothetical protein
MCSGLWKEPGFISKKVSSIVFSLVIMELMDEIDGSDHIPVQLWYLDDGTFISSRKDVVNLYCQLKTKGPSYGLTCEPWEMRSVFGLQVINCSLSSLKISNVFQHQMLEWRFWAPPYVALTNFSVGVFKVVLTKSLHARNVCWIWKMLRYSYSCCAVVCPYVSSHTC